jgi:ADP-heptose:LPS heptosyltransferase
MTKTPIRQGIFLQCEGIGDCLYAIPVIRKIRSQLKPGKPLEIFTYNPNLFLNCPYVDAVFHISKIDGISKGNLELITLFQIDGPADNLNFKCTDTIDFISHRIGLGQLSFAEKRLEYFPAEEDQSDVFDVVLNTSQTWPSRSWPIKQWQMLADDLIKMGKSVAVVGKDYESVADDMIKKSPPLKNCVNLVNKLSLDQTFFTIAKAGLFVTCQNGLAILAGATDCTIIQLDNSIDWSKRPIFRNESPNYKFHPVKGNCTLYCRQSHECPLESKADQFSCVPKLEDVKSVIKPLISG